MTARTRLCLLLIVICPMAGPRVAGSSEPIPLGVGPRAGLEITRESDAWTLETTGTNPHFWTPVIPPQASLATHPILAFDYFSDEPVEGLRIRVPGKDKPFSLEGGGLPVAETWQPASFDLRLSEVPYATGEEHRFALVWKTGLGQRVRLRNLRLRAPNAEEALAAEERERIWNRRVAEGERWLSYLEAIRPSRIESISVRETELVIRATKPPGAWRRLGVIAIPLAVSSQGPPPVNAPIEGVVDDGANDPGRMVWTVPRFVEGRDRADLRWKVGGVDPDGVRHVLSAAFYPDEVAPSVSRDLERESAATIKGLGGIPTLTPDHEIFTLGIGHATVNIVLNALISDEPRAGWERWDDEGRAWFINPRYRDTTDGRVRLLSRRGIVVSAILLVGNGRHPDGTAHHPMTHPEAIARERFAMPNLAEPRGAAIYRAAIRFLADRHTREDRAFGRVANWILHNEIDQAGTWTNMGDQPLSRYLESYLRSARVVHHNVRLHDPHGRVFVSLTHHWTKRSPGQQTYVVRDILELLARAAKVEGDFDWGVAYHPYPQSLFEPRTWEDEEATHDFETAYITPKNIEVLPAYLAQPRFLYRGRPRGILLSEQGINAPSLSPEDQRVQAAGIVYTMRRVAQLPAIEAFHYHAYLDKPEAEGGLLLGLTNEQRGRKLAWEVYAAIDTARENEASAFAWEIIGVPGPEAIRVREEIGR